MAIAFAGNPDLLLLDEPSYGQDSKNVDVILGEIRALADSGSAIVVSTHDPELLARIAGHVVEIRDGRARTIIHTADQAGKS